MALAYSEIQNIELFIGTQFGMINPGVITSIIRYILLTYLRELSISVICLDVDVCVMERHHFFRQAQTHTNQ